MKWLTGFISWRQTMSDQDRVRLAEAMGWTKIDEALYGKPPEGWRAPYPRWPDSETTMRKPVGNVWKWKIPDPFTDANDCEALIRRLNDRGYKITIEFLVSHVEIEITYPDSVYCERGDGQNWKLLLCNLALQAIDND
jgi:hypothetical protein